jgi:Transposase
MQSLMVYAGVSDVYAESEEFFERLLRVSVSSSQVYRVTMDAGEALCEEALYEGKKYEETVYGMVDGSMIFTDNGWKEVKVGRVFSSQALVRQGSKATIPRFEVQQSDDCACQDTNEVFKPKFEALLAHVSAEQLVLINDGCTWIGQWLQSEYPKATHILDYYHAVEHLAQATQNVRKSSDWLEKQKTLLKESKLDKVIDNIQKIKALDKKNKDKLIQYYQNNRYRMDYATYLANGLCIGSGAIEAAHRTLIQKRMKLSGQRWGTGTNAMIKLRVAFKSNKQQLVNQLFRNNATI